MSKSCNVVAFFLAGCSLVLIHRLAFPTKHAGPVIVRGKGDGRPFKVIEHAAEVVEITNDQSPGQLRTTFSTDAGFEKGESFWQERAQDGRKKFSGSGKLDDLVAKTMPGASDVDDTGASINYDGQSDDDSEASIADIWEERDEEDDTWRKYEEEYSTMKWERSSTAFQLWRDGLKMFGVNSHKNFLVTHDSVEIGQVLPFYMSRQHTYTASELFMRLIPKESPYKKKSVGRCAVVGNSGNLWHSGCGKQIDSADYIFRCNIPPLDDYEEDVGHKTNLTTMNPSMLIFDHGTVSLTRKPDFPFNLVLEPYDGVIILPCFSHFFYLRQCIKALKQYYRKNANVTFLQPEHFINVWDYWKERGLINLPSTGFYIVSTAAMLCDQVDLYGFWPFEKTGLSGRPEHVMYHYWEDGNWGPAHDKSGEFGLLFKMHQDGAIRLQLGNCSSTGLL